MAVEISTLVIEVDSTSVKQSEQALDRFADSSAAAARTAQGVASAGDQMSTSYRKVSAASSIATDGAQRYIEAMQRELYMLGKTREEIERQEAINRHFTRSEQEKVVALATSIEAYHRQEEAMKELAAAQDRAEAAATAFINRLKQEADTVGMTRQQILQYHAAQLGVSASAAPLIAKLHEAEKAVGGLGMSAKQLNSVMRGVPAQMTDIFVSLASGQAPMMVLIQQGGQLKDMFGGLGNMARGLGGYVLGMVNPFTLVASAVAGVTFAFEKGASEQRDFQRTLTLTGGAAGVTAGQLSDMAAGINRMSEASQGQASEALNIFVNAGVKGRSELERFTQVAIEFERAGGGAVEKVAEHFANLAKDPLQASIKLNESTNFLTKSVYEQIKALEEQGRTTDAAKAAQEAYSDALRDRTPELLKNLGLIERAWLGIKDMTKAAADAALGVGRPQTLSQSIDDKRGQISGLESLVDAGAGGAEVVARRKILLEMRRQELYGLTEQLRLEQRVAGMQAQQADQMKALVEWNKVQEESLGRQEKMNRELARVRNLGQNAGASPEAIRAAEAAVAKKFEEPAKKAKDPTQDAAYQEAMRQAKARQALRIKEYDEIEEWLQAQLEQRKKFEERVDAEAAKRESAMFTASDAIRAQALAQEQANEVFGKGKSALAELALAQMEKSRADLEATNNVMPGAIQAIELQIAEQERLIAALKKGEGLEKNKKAMDDFQSMVNQIDSSKLDGLFNGALKGVEKLITATQVLATWENKAGKARSALDDDRASGAISEIEFQEKAKKLEGDRLTGSLQMYGQIAGAAKSMFEEGTSGYKAMEVAQAALGMATAASAIATQGLGDPYTAIPRIIAMAATMAQLGFAINGLSGAGGPAPTNEGTGTVFGDASAKSASIENSIDMLADSAILGLRYSAAMAASLKNIEAAMTGVTSLLLRGNGVEAMAGRIQTGTMGTGLSGAVESINKLSSVATFGPLLGNFTDNVLGGLLGGLQNKIFGKKVSVTGGGITADARSLGDIFDNGFRGQYYTDIQEKRLLGRTKSRTVFSDLDGDIADQFGLIFDGIGDTVLSAADSLGLGLDAVKDRLVHFVVDIGRIDLKGLSGTEIQEKLSAVFGAEADKIAAAVVPGLEELVKVGEGPFETLVRVAHQLEVVDMSLGLMGMSLSRVAGGAEYATTWMDSLIASLPQSGVDRAINADKLVQQFGGLDQFTEATDEFYRAFWSQADQTRNNIDLLTKSLSGLGLDLPATASGFRDLVMGLDLTSDEGRQAFEVLTKVGPAFKQLQDDLLQGAGIGADEMASVIRDGLLGRASQDDVGTKLGTMVTDGLQNALAGSLSEQITASFTNSFLMPMLQSIVTTGTIGAALSQASIDGFVSEANAKIRAFNAVISSPEVQGALTQLQNGLTGITGSMKGLTSAVTMASQTINDAARSTANAADIAWATDPALRAYAASIEAASKAREAWNQVASTIVDEINRLRGVGGADTSLANAQSQFYIATAQARAGDVEAFKLLPSLSQLVEQSAERSVRTALEFQTIKAQLSASLEQTLYGSAAPTLTPAIPGLGGGYGAPTTAYQSGTSDVRTEIAGLRAENKLLLEALNIAMSKLNRVVERWEVAGVPVVNQPGEVLEVRE